MKPAARAALALVSFTILSACTGGAEVSEGRLQRIVVDRPERGESTIEYRLQRDDGEEIALGFDRDRADWLNLPTGARLRVTGAYAATGADQVRRLIADHVEQQDHEEQAAALIVDPAMPPAPRRLAVVLFNFQNDDRQPLSPDEARRKIFTDPNSVRAFHKEQSFGFIDLGGKIDKVQGDVFGWYTLPANNRPCAESKWDDMALAMAANQGIDTAGYDHYVFIFPYTDACVYGGRGEQPGKNTWINGGSIRTMNHELGHNFGTPHAASWTCTSASGERVSLSSTCRPTEYGNPFDVMGHGYRHTNAFNKARARWLGSGNIEEVGKTGIYTLLPQEKPSNGVQLLSTLATQSDSYYVEYRQPFGYDDFAPDAPAATGVIVLYGGPLRSLTTSFLLDMNPATTTFADAPLGVGKSFVGPGIRITLVDRTPQAARVRFEFSDGGFPAPVSDGGLNDAERDAGASDAAREVNGAEVEAQVNPATGGPSPGTGGTPRAGSGGSGGRSSSGTGGQPSTPVADPPAPGGGCGCVVGGAGTPTPLAAPLAAALGLLLLRRRRARRAALATPPVLLMLVLFSLVPSACQNERAGVPKPATEVPLSQPRKDAGDGPSTSGSGGNSGGQGGQAGQGQGGQAGQGGAPVTESPDVPASPPSDAGVGDTGALRPPDAGDGGVTTTITLSAVPPDVAAACARHAQVYCARLDECLTDGVRRNYGDLTFCHARREQTCRLDLMTPGRTETPARRLSCADALARQSCREYMFSRPLPACDYPAGTLTRGAPCHRISQCAAGLACEIELDETCGTCQPALALGDDCSFWSGGCPQGAACYADQCLMPLTLAAPCKRTAASCLGGMTCTDAGCAEKIGDVGADCRSNDICDSMKSLFCDLSNGKCTPLPAPVAIGQPCGVVDATGAASRCGEGASCFAPPASPTRRICVARLPAGMKCDLATGPLCAPPAECTRGLCVVPRIVMGPAPTYTQCK